MRRLISKISGKIFSIKLPALLQKKINKIFVNFFKIDLSEFKRYDKYTSLQDLFIRDLKKMRRFSSLKTDLIAPTDSKIIQYGKLISYTLLQIKGIEYNIKKFLGSDISINNLKKIKNGEFINFYLSPKDYHHFHAPTDMFIQKIVHIHGDLYPVKESFIKKRKVFSENERVILECKLQEKGKLLYFVLIGALNVGNIKIYKEAKIKTNSSSKKINTYSYKKPLFIKKGEDIGYFSFGSSVVIISEKNSIKYINHLLNKKIKFGDTIGTLL